MTNKNSDMEVVDGQTSSAFLFESSLKPLILLLNLFGFYIPTGKINTHSFSYGNHWAWILFFIGILFLLASFTYYIFASVVTYKMMSINGLGLNGTNLTRQVLITYGLAWLNMAGYTTGVHLSLFIAIWFTPRNWKRLWIKLQEISFRINLQPEFYRQTKKIVWISFLLLIIDTAMFFYPISVSPIWFWNIPQLYPIYLAILNLTSFIVRTIVSLLFVLNFCAANLFTALNFKMKTLIWQYEKEGNNGSLLASELEKWKGHHILVCEFVDKINRCFSFVILVTIGNGYLSFITNFYNIVTGLMNNDKIITALFAIILLREFIFLFTFIYASNKLKTEVKSKLKLNQFYI